VTATPSNEQIASALAEYSALLELSGASGHAARAFQRGAELVRGTALPMADLIRRGHATDLRGIGPGLDRRMREFVETGAIAELEELRRTISPELAVFGRMHGFGASRFAAIGTALGIRTVAELRGAADTGRLQSVPGVGPHTEARILAALASPAPLPRSGLRLDRARAISTAVAQAMGGVPAGDVRRWVDRPARLAVVVPATGPEDVGARFAALPEIVAMLEPDIGVTPDGVPIELVVSPPEQLGTALVRATGSHAYVTALEPLPQAATEQRVFELLGLRPVPPELRELGAPSPPGGLLDRPDIRGDLHCHTTWSDGRAGVREMAEAARALGYDYLAICDHTRGVRVVPGLDADDLRRQAVEIEAANAALGPFRVLRGVECDILPDGGLDLPDDMLGELDWVQISLHAGQRARRDDLTARVVHAMHHPAARCLSHPTGRIIGHRAENALDLERTFEAALETGVALEVNGLASRLDLSAEHVREAVAAGVSIVCSSDAHSTAGLENMVYAVHTARRGGAPAAEVLNTAPIVGGAGRSTSAGSTRG
jgi:DNA polymerase (family 10)